jgi:hypothetical protein
MDGYFACDEIIVIVHRLRELIGESQEHSRMAFMYSANDIFSDLVESVDQAWTSVEQIGQGLELAARAASESPDQDRHS